MAARDGMADLISQLRSMVDDSGSAYFTDDRLQVILDNSRLDFFHQGLTIQDQQIDGTVVYKIYQAPYQNLEGSATGAAAWRLHDSQGTALTSDLSIDFLRGIITFDNDQKGSARYLDGRAYDLNYAASQAWREMAGKVAAYYNFTIENRSYTRAQWYDHCMALADNFENESTLPGVGGGASWAEYERGDFLP